MRFRRVFNWLDGWKSIIELYLFDRETYDYLVSYSEQEDYIICPACEGLGWKTTESKNTDTGLESVECSKCDGLGIMRGVEDG